ncbi:hypothetical protein BTJ68_03287 [Hortaea werneckii EXF-2000]|uniref:Uncharacterized protein n=1 Tax=Hortaea werneckii EXF-2000 TaxID=1157616 RepID=A0A1Z5TLC7_HORWE|nr:hypothetical protein BTJ68_03287 [Hortaea werneckii EXF-2000]
MSPLQAWLRVRAQSRQPRRPTCLTNWALVNMNMIKDKGKSMNRSLTRKLSHTKHPAQLEPKATTLMLPNQLRKRDWPKNNTWKLKIEKQIDWIFSTTSSG